MKTCMNISCGTTSSAEWKSGWPLRSGDFATLCDKCGYAFEQRVYCEEFHADESGWRLCATCGKRLHCGCTASLPLIELLDGGGVKCINCATKLEPASGFNERNCEGSGSFTSIGIYNGKNGSSQLSLPLHPNTNVALGVLKPEGSILPPAEAGTSWISNLPQTSMGIFQKAKLDMSTNIMQTRDNDESVVHPNLNMTLGGPSRNLLSTPGAAVGEREQKKTSNISQQGFLSPSLMSTPPKFGFSRASDTNGTMISHMRVARPPADGRGRHQLLPRYWPRITDQELQQISGNANCIIVPLFEKVLSASDAGRIGRLVLPKACAETYFPPISQPEGLPIKIQDIKGNEWVFQFRFWPNNNSRMYVLEGVTPCIQSMQLQAGDTVTFSRMDPEGKLVMGYRKASHSASTQPIKGSTDIYLNALSRQLDSVGGNIKLHNNETFGEKTEEGLLPTSNPMTGSKKSQNIGSKSKRLLMDSQDAQELRLTWEEVQGMLRPPQNANSTIVTIEDYEFEEYEEPPVLGKNSIFTARSSGLLEQWAQCDSCSKWRRLPGDILLPPKWTCADNAWDQTRCFCSAPDELRPRELESILNLSKDSRKKRMVMASGIMQEQELPGLNALANAVVLGDNSNDPGTSSVAATTKHPRHRPGCSCIVCIQPPSGKGKHKSTCTCTVCMTVKRRFKTLMMRKRKRQSDQEAEMVLKNHQMPNGNNGDDKVEVETNGLHHDHQLEGEDDLQAGIAQRNDCPVGLLANSSMGLDLNCYPERGSGMRSDPAQVSLTNLPQLKGLPSEAYMNQNVLANLTSEQPDSSVAHTEQVAQESERQHVDDPVSQAPHQQASPENGCSEPDNDKQQNDLR